ncbi:MAG TPA: NAD(+) synthase [Armatimonadota bacterium]|nr:NAD(+) synthase [Armatimonadota bacterium]HOS43580.1 NAD(+) synthase [Armatimonadota bacterium]
MQDPRYVLNINPELVRRILVEAIRHTGEAIRGEAVGRWVVNLSGGLDSAIVAFLACEAVGPENVRALLLPYRTSMPASREDAMRVVEALGIGYQVYDITPAVDGLYLSKGDDPDAANKRAKGNVMARMRMIFGYEECERWNALMLGTSNKSETLLGYTTIWGDSASALNLIADLYKTQVRQLARNIGVPQVVVDKAPSADLEPNQTDESDIGFSYYAVDSVLARFVDMGMLPDEIKADLRATQGELGIDWDAAVDKLCGVATEAAMRPGLVDIMEYKRRMTPIVPKISRATIELDYRPPKQWGR